MPHIQHPYPAPAFREPEGRGPYFVAQNQDELELNENFVIVSLRTEEEINQIYTATVRAIVPSALGKKSGQSTNVKTTEDFFASQMLKHVTICMEQPNPEYISKDLFQLKTYFHGILTSASIEIAPQCEIVELELRPYFWLLTQQNNWRSFEDMDAKEILTEVLEPYKTAIKDNKFSVEFMCDPLPKRIQTLQNGTSDSEFAFRLMKENGVSLLHYATAKTSILVFTTNVANTLSKIRERFPDITRNLSFFIAPDIGAQNPAHPPNYNLSFAHNRDTIPLWDYKTSVCALPDSIKATAYPDYRDAGATFTSIVPQDIYPKSDAFKLQPSLWLPTTQLSAAQNKDKDEYLESVLKSRLARTVSSKIQRSARTTQYGFSQLWHACDVDLNLNPRHVAHTPTDYESALKKTQKFYPYKIKQIFERIFPAFPSPHGNFNHNLPPAYHTLNVELKFFNVDDNDFKPPLPISTQELSELCQPHHTGIGGLYSATVVAFKPSDETKNSYDVPNMYRIRFPWHKKGESVRARVSTFWAPGSLFLPDVPETAEAEGSEAESVKAIGTEVMVAFVIDDPDYPVIIGSCYNSKNPYPLADVTKREQKGAFGARGIVFKDGAAELIFKTVKSNKSEVQVLSLLANSGNISLAASEEIAQTATKVDIKAEQSFKSVVTESGSSIQIDENGVVIQGTNGDNTLSLKKGGTFEGSATNNLKFTGPKAALNKLVTTQ